MSIPSLSQVVPQHAAPLRKQVIDEIRRAIVSNEYPPGSRLVERVLCEQMRVSRTVVREALRQLEAEYLIDMIPNVGSVVRLPTPTEVRSLYDVRASLESLAASQCASRSTPDIIARLKQRLDDIPGIGEDIQKRISAQDAFIDLIVEGSGNVVIGEMLSSIHWRLSRLRTLTLAAGGPDRLIPGLTRIFSAVRDGDVLRAERETRDYVAMAESLALDVLAKEQAEAG